MMGELTLVFVAEGCWWVAHEHQGQVCAVRVDNTPDGATIEARVAGLRQQLESMQIADRPIVLALGSSWCLSAAISTEELDRGSRRRAMGYRLEEHLPVSAEDVVADYVSIDSSHALGVCAEFGRLAPLVAAMEAANLNVRHISPATLLAAAGAIQQHSRVDGILIANHEEHGPSQAGYDFIALQSGKPSQWWWLAGDKVAVREQVSAWAGSSGQAKHLVSVCCDDGLSDSLSACVALDVIREGESRLHLATRHVAGTLDAGVSPWVDLRRDSLAASHRLQAGRRPLWALAAAGAVLLACVMGASLWRGAQYSALRDQCLQDQMSVVKEAIPGGPASGSVKRRLASERQRLACLSGQATEGADPAALHPTSALVHLRDVLKSLPPQLRYRILDVSIQPDAIRMDGQARSHADAEALTESFRQLGAYDVEPPKTRALREGGVSFTFTATARQATTRPVGGAQ